MQEGYPNASSVYDMFHGQRVSYSSSGESLRVAVHPLPIQLEVSIVISNTNSLLSTG